MLITTLCRSSDMSEEPRILLQHASLQSYMPLPVWPWPSLWAGRSACGGLWLSGGNSPEQRERLYPKDGVCLSPPGGYNASRVWGYRRTKVVSCLSEYWQPFKMLNYHLTWHFHFCSFFPVSCYPLCALTKSSQCCCSSVLYLKLCLLQLLWEWKTELLWRLW